MAKKLEIDQGDCGLEECGRGHRCWQTLCIRAGLPLCIVLGIAAGLLLLATLGLEPLRAQQPQQNPQKPDISVQVNVVTVLATVRDKRGAVVANLGKVDFDLEEDGRPQTIAYFARETDLPLRMGLLVDTSGSMSRVLSEEKAASYQFLDQMLREDKDLAFVLHFDREVELLQDFTASRQRLKIGLDMIERPELERAGDRRGGSDQGGGGPRRGGGFAGGTTLYDAIYLASDELMMKQQGRKALIVLSDGVDRGSKESLQEAIEAAQRADTLVYSILFAGEQGGGLNRGGFGGGFPGGRGGGGGGGGGRRGGGDRFPEEQLPDGKKVLQRISNETGGRMFEREKMDSIDQIYMQIEEELRSQYNLGYTPAAIKPGYHKIQLATKQKGFTVRAREGYYSTASQEQTR